MTDADGGEPTEHPGTEPVPPTPVPPTPEPPTPVQATTPGPDTADADQPPSTEPAANAQPTSEPSTPVVAATVTPPPVDALSARPDPGPDGRDDWPAKAADSIVDLVDSVREVTTGRALTLATALVYGIVLAGAAIAAGILLVIVGFRINERAYALIAEGVFDMPDPQPMWAVYVTWGVICLLVGLVLWRKRPKLDPPTQR